MRWLWRHYSAYKASGLARRFKWRRYERIIQALGVTPPASILEIGCGTGADFMRFAVEDGFDAYGVDVREWGHMAPFDFTKGDARELPFPDKRFDAAVSIGLFEHLQPIEDLCRAVSEITRVARRYAIVVPSVGTPIEPHMMSFLWGIRGQHRKPESTYPLLHLSDEAWTQFAATRGARSQRFWYMPLVQNLLVHG